MNDRELLEGIRYLIGKEETADDCASFPLGDGEQILVSTIDMLHETTDFPKGMSEWEIGWMSVAVSLSDVASCGARPTQVLVAAGLDREERLKPIMEGAVACASAYGAKVAGGDIDNHRELTIVTTAFGIVDKNFYCRRSGASPGDLVVISGTPGAAQAGLDGYEQYWQNLVRPLPQVREGQRAARAGAHAMMDVSDGLAISLYDMGEASNVGFVLYDELPYLPIPDGGKYFLYGGGDYGLLYTIPRGKLCGGVVIGEVVEGQGVFLQGKRVEKKGYSHLWE